jgi:hypothetical protein
VFPECFQKSLELIATAKSKTGEKAVGSAIEVHDVCATCNNQDLSPLDDYFCQLNSQYFSKIVRPGDSVRFQYDFDLLLRSLLKIVYNAARSRGWDATHFKNITDYIRGKGERPDSVYLFLQLLVPSTRTIHNSGGSAKTEEITPLPIQAYVRTVTGFSAITAEFSISIWSYHFYLLFVNPQTSKHVLRTEIDKWLREPKKRGALELTAAGERMVYASSVDVLQIAEDSPVFREQVHKAREYLSRKKT